MWLEFFFYSNESKWTWLWYKANYYFCDLTEIKSTNIHDM